MFIYVAAHIFDFFFVRMTLNLGYQCMMRSKNPPVPIVKIDVKKSFEIEMRSPFIMYFDEAPSEIVCV